MYTTTYDRMSLGGCLQNQNTRRRNTSKSFISILSSTLFPPRPSFVDTVQKGDVLICGSGIGGLVGHAALMTSEYWVLEMQGGEGWHSGIEDNNRRISKYDWYDLHSSDYIIVYRNKVPSVADEAADWATRNYFNESGGTEKTQHVTYRLTNDFISISPSYCSKLVLQAYHFGTGSKNVIAEAGIILTGIIVPTAIPNYFHNSYALVKKGTFGDLTGLGLSGSSGSSSSSISFGSS